MCSPEQCKFALSELSPDLRTYICDYLKRLQKAARKPITVSESAVFADLTEDLQNLVLQRFERQRRAAWQEIHAVIAYRGRVRNQICELHHRLDSDEERDLDNKTKAVPNDFFSQKLAVLQDMMIKRRAKKKMYFEQKRISGSRNT